MKHLPKKQREKRMSEQHLKTLQDMLVASLELLEYYEDSEGAAKSYCPYCIRIPGDNCSPCPWIWFTGNGCERFATSKGSNIVECRVNKPDWFLKERIPALRKWITWIEKGIERKENES
jgi:hypothetical protein